MFAILIMQFQQEACVFDREFSPFGPACQVAGQAPIIMTLIMAYQYFRTRQQLSRAPNPCFLAGADHPPQPGSWFVGCGSNEWWLPGSAEKEGTGTHEKQLEV